MAHLAGDYDDALVETLRSSARQSASRVLRTWLPMMFGGGELHSLGAAYGVTLGHCATYDAAAALLLQPFTAAHLDQLVQPPGSAVPLLLEVGKSDETQRSWDGKLDMYWRGALALHKMSAQALRTMAERRLHLHDDLGMTEAGARSSGGGLGHVTAAPIAAGDGATTDNDDNDGDAVMKLRLIQALLPEYTMVAEEPAAYAKRMHQQAQRAADRQKAAGRRAAVVDGSEPSASGGDSSQDEEGEEMEVLSRAEAASAASGEIVGAIDGSEIPSVKSCQEQPEAQLEGQPEVRSEHQDKQADETQQQRQLPARALPAVAGGETTDRQRALSSVSPKRTAKKAGQGERLIFIVLNARTEYVGKYQSCMVSK